MGTDLQASWPTEQHFTSWLGLTPKRDISGGKVIRHVCHNSSNRVAGILRLAATSLLNSDSYLGARHRGLRMRLGAPKAIKASARYLACIIYRLFTKGQEWVDRGAEKFEQNRQAREFARLQAQANARGLRLVTAGEAIVWRFRRFNGSGADPKPSDANASDSGLRVVVSGSAEEPGSGGGVPADSEGIRRRRHHAGRERN